MLNTEAITKAVTILRAGGLVAFPTETVYGLGADARQADAIRRVFLAKERPFDHPLIVHLAGVDQLEDWAIEVPQSALVLAKAFWPGPLTLVLKKQPGVLDLVTGGQATVGVRVPRHPVALALLQAFGSGLVAPSANKFTHISPTTAEAVREELGAAVAMVLEGGACEVGVESTIVDLTGDQPVILRPGMITPQAMAAVLGEPVTVRRQDVPTTVRTPGMHHVHYAPSTKTVVVAREELAAYLLCAAGPVAVMTRGEMALPEDERYHQVTMPMAADSYAQALYRTLRQLDQRGVSVIVVEQVPTESSWDAIRDRLNRATGERE